LKDSNRNTEPAGTAASSEIVGYRDRNRVLPAESLLEVNKEKVFHHLYYSAGIRGVQRVSSHLQAEGGADLHTILDQEILFELFHMGIAVSFLTTVSAARVVRELIHAL